MSSGGVRCLACHKGPARLNKSFCDACHTTVALDRQKSQLMERLVELWIEKLRIDCRDIGGYEEIPVEVMDLIGRKLFPAKRIKVRC